jgi:hypothetical protein
MLVKYYLYDFRNEVKSVKKMEEKFVKIRMQDLELLLKSESVDSIINISEKCVIYDSEEGSIGVELFEQETMKCSICLDDDRTSMMIPEKNHFICPVCKTVMHAL